MSKHVESGRHFLQIPGPTNVPDRVLRAISAATIDHRGPQFAELGLDVLARLKSVFKTDSNVIIFPSSGTGAWEAAIINALSPGDHVLMFETGHFSSLWHKMAESLGLTVDIVAGDWRTGVDPDVVESRLREDSEGKIKAVMAVHNETATGVASRIGEVREAMDRAGHDALLMVDTISSLGSIDFRMDEWRVDVTVAGSQKGLMLPPGLGFTAISERARQASEQSTFRKSYWNWAEMIAANESGYFPYTPATNLLYGLQEALTMLLDEEGLDAVFSRHDRHAEATRRAVKAWGLEVLATNPAEYSSSLTAVVVPDGISADAVRGVILDCFDMSLGTGLGRLSDKIFRIGHLGHFNDLMLAGTLAGVEMGLAVAGVPHQQGGVLEATRYLSECARKQIDAVETAA